MINVDGCDLIALVVNIMERYYEGFIIATLYQQWYANNENDYKIILRLHDQVKGSIKCIF